MKITERRVQMSYWFQYNSAHRVICPNHTPAGWWECDILSITKAGYFMEHEIKLTLADYKKDEEKKDDGGVGGLVRLWDEERQRTIYRRGTGERKHDLLADGNERGPNRFYFVVTKDMASQIEVPQWAGLKTVRECSVDVLRFDTIKDAPKLHGKKMDEKLIEKMRDTFYWRFWSERTKRTRMEYRKGAW